MPKQRTVFNALLKYLPTKKFTEIVQHYEGDKWTKQFGCWDLLVILLQGHFTQQMSLRSLTLSHQCCAQALARMAVKPMPRSTLSEACQQRKPAVFMGVLGFLWAQLRAAMPVEQTLNHFIYLIDSTPIALKGKGYEWAQDNYRTKGLKVHIVYDEQLKSPASMLITAPNVNDITPAKAFRLKPNSIYIYDKAYYDYGWWNRIHKKGSYFVTRLKKDAPFKIKQRNSVTGEPIVHDWVIQLTSKAGQAYEGLLRHIRVRLPTGKTIAIVSNDLINSAQAIAALYKKRWEIESFFKCIKQTLKIKQFWGRSENSVKLQIICALIAYVLLRLLQVRLLGHYSIQQIAIILRSRLYDHASLEQIMNMTEKISTRKRYENLTDKDNI